MQRNWVYHMVGITTGNKIYRDIKIGKNRFIRKFNSINKDDFVWHRDTKDRIITLELGTCQLQFENELPIDIQLHAEYFIPKETYHRIIPSSLLTFKIREL